MDFDYVIAPALIVSVGIFIAWLCLRRIRRVHVKSYRMRRKVSESIALSLVIFLAVAVAGSTSFNAFASHHFKALHPAPGTVYPVNGRNMHLYCTGTGSPTLILDAGLGSDSLIWGAIQPELSKTTRVCSYDRAGFGWSDPLPAPRDADHIADELHGLLLQAKVGRNIVLMGHSIAGIYIRDYALRYPQDVSGLIFVDSSTPLQEQRPEFKALAPQGPILRLQVLLNKSIFLLGVPRIVGACSRTVPGFGAGVGKELAEDLCRPRFDAVLGELDSIKRSGDETVHSGPYGALPILIFSHDPQKTLPRYNPPKQLVELETALSQMQEDLKNLSTRSRRIIAKDSTHFVQIDRADLLKKEVPIFIQQIRGSAAQSTAYGSTSTE